MDTSDGPGGWRGGYSGGRGGYRSRDYPPDDRRGGYNDNYNRGYDGGWRGGSSGGRSGSGRYNDGYQGGGRGRTGGYDDGYQAGGSRGGGGRGSYRGRGRYNWGRSGGGAGSGGRSPGPRRRDVLPDDVVALTELKCHTKLITALFFDPASQQLYSGSQDSQVCAWSCSTGQMVTAVDVGGSIDSLLVEAGFLFVGLHAGQEGIVKVFNLNAGGAMHQLTGHKGEVYALAAANGCLFSGGLDHSIRVWAFNQAAGIFISQAILTAASGGGHDCPVHALTAQGQFMFSGDRNGVIKVWDLAQGSCVQTLRAHAKSVTSLMIWGDNYLLSSSFDASVKAWSPGSSPGCVINTEPEFTYRGDDEGGSAGSGAQRGGAGRGLPGGVVTMSGTVDGQQRSVLMMACAVESSIRLLELPSFESRGTLPEVDGCRALTSLPGSGIMVAGDRSGAIKIFQWKA